MVSTAHDLNRERPWTRARGMSGHRHHPAVALDTTVTYLPGLTDDPLGRLPDVATVTALPPRREPVPCAMCDAPGHRDA